jgi:hypothetical protein
MGGDITMYFAKQYPDEIRKVVTLDNLRVPFTTSGKFKILTFRSKDPQVQDRPWCDPERGGVRKGRHHRGEDNLPA